MKAETNASIDTSRTGSLLGIADAPVPKAFGRYKIEKELGKGAMGVVYLAEDTQLHRKVALKIPKKSALEAPDALERFYREARTTATLRHNNICPVYDVGAIDGTHYITMAYIPGKPVSSFLGKGKLPRARQVALLIRKIALALEEAHRNGVIHRDLKPSNVMLDDRSEPIVMDFGLARNTNTSEDARITQTGAILGTPAYMAPEQVRGDLKRIGPQSDIYALGVMMYQFLTGEVPFNGPMMTVFSQIMSTLPKRPSELRPEVDSTLESICEKMMAKEIDQRYASMKEVVTVLTEYLKKDLVARQEPGAAKMQASATVVSEPDPNLDGLPTIPDVVFEEYKSETKNAAMAVRLCNVWNRGRKYPWFWPAAVLLCGLPVSLFVVISVPRTESIVPPKPLAEDSKPKVVAVNDAPKVPRRPFLPVGTVFAGTTRFFEPGIDAADRASDFTMTITRRERNWVEAKGELHKFNKTWIYRGFCTDSGDDNGDILIEDVDCVGEENPAEGNTTMVVQIRGQGEQLQGVGFLGLECSEFSGSLQKRGESQSDDTDSTSPELKIFPEGTAYQGTWNSYAPGSKVINTSRDCRLRIIRREGSTVEAEMQLESPSERWVFKGQINSREGKAPSIVFQDIDLIDGFSPLEGTTTMVYEAGADGTTLSSHGFSTLGNRFESRCTVLNNGRSHPAGATQIDSMISPKLFPLRTTYAGTWHGYPPGSNVAMTERAFRVRITRRENAVVETELHLEDPEQKWSLKGRIVRRDEQSPILLIQDIDLIDGDHPLEGKTTLLFELSEDGTEFRSRGFSTIGLRSVSDGVLAERPEDIANDHGAAPLPFPSGATFRGVWRNFSAGQKVAEAETELTVTVTERKDGSFAAEWFMKERSATWLFKGNIAASDQGRWSLRADDIDLIGADHPNEGNTVVVAELTKDGKLLRGTAFYKSGARSEFETTLVRPADHRRD